jgi:hypothetical protein
MPPDHPSLAEQLAEAKRELALRQRTYPAWILRGTIEPALAERRLALQVAIVQTLQRQLEAESGQQPLFDQEPHA